MYCESALAMHTIVEIWLEMYAMRYNGVKEEQLWQLSWERMGNFLLKFILMIH